AWCALRGFDVTLQDREMKYVQPALDRARDMFTKKLKTPARMEPALARLKADVEGNGIASADLVIEAIFENAQAKEALYRATEPQLKPDALLATNTSSIPLDELRGAVQTPSRFLGLHYFNPVALMPLIEIVRHDALDPSVEKRALAFCKAIDKLPVPVAGTPGFLVNRILMPYMLEAARAYSEGIPGPTIDKAAKKFGMPMGPIELIDTVGLDICLAAGKALVRRDSAGQEPPAPRILLDKVALGQLGKKSGQGIYRYEDGKPIKGQPDAVTQDIIDALVEPYVQEAKAVLAEGIVPEADLIDAGLIFGTGFAPFRGGPLNYAKEMK
ncbi:MAG: 3-hydroxyacyl-CoA dehydrogenase family protein, partial [Betaproteobacteria bacterium]